MSSATPIDLTTASSTISFTPAESSILPYTEGLTGVNLWLNTITSDVLYGTLGLIFVLVLCVRVAQVTGAHVRLLATLHLNNEQQQYWSRDRPFWNYLKKHLLFAPLIRKRHNKEFQLSTAVNVGTIPSRLHTLFITFYALSNVVYCCLLDYHHQTRASLLAEARGRTAHLAVMNMIPLFIFSARNNPLIPLLGISFDTFNLFHRWIGRIVVIESLAHTFIWGVNNYDARGLGGLTSHLKADPFLVYGLISTVTMTTIIFQSVSAVRHAFYESFLHLHQVLVIAALAGLLLHCESQALPQKPVLYALISLWGLERLIRLFRIFYRRGTTVTIKALDGGACRVTFDIRGTWGKTPGRHIYAYIPSISLWMSHPFSIAWVETQSIEDPTWISTLDRSKTLTPTITHSPEEDFKPIPRKQRTAISCIMAARTGMTSSLYKRAYRAPSRTLNLKAFVEGPYGGLENLNSYGTILLFAGGVGITHQLSIFHSILLSFSTSTCSTRKVSLIWSVRSLSQLDWVRPWLEELHEIPKRGREVRILLYVTRTDLEGGEAKEMGIEERITFGRMNVRELIKGEWEQRVGAMSVGVCGPGGLADDVRREVRDVMGGGVVDFWEECFTW